MPHPATRRWGYPVAEFAGLRKANLEIVVGLYKAQDVKEYSATTIEYDHPLIPNQKKDGQPA